VFPDILPEEKVMSFFQTLSGFYTQEQKGANDVIDEHLFIETLALSALEMKF
jgi:hypothetical protein